MKTASIIPIGCDHAGYTLKEKIMTQFTALGYSFKDYGCFSDKSIDYPDYGHPVANYIEEHPAHLGIVICGSGNGINMTVNKHQGVRSALCWTTEIASLAKQHNNANVLALPSRFISEEEALKMVEAFLTTDFEGGRHQWRVDKIGCQ